MACLWVVGHRQYGAEYVAKLASMVGRHLSVEHEVVCLTDRPSQVPQGVRPVFVETVLGQRAWWLKLQCFDPAMPFDGARILYLDLDVLITGPLDDIALYDAPFAIAPDQNPKWAPAGPLAVVKGYNSSVMAWKRGKRAKLYTLWTPAVARRLWGDQDWIAERLPGAATFPEQWFRRISWGGPNGEDAAATKVKPWHPDTRVVLAIKPKPHVATETMPWINEYWR